MATSSILSASTLNNTTTQAATPGITIVGLVQLDPQDYRNNVALGTLAFNSADWALAEQCARAALQRAHRLNKNPRDGEASMLLASVLERMGDDAARGITITKPPGAVTAVTPPGGRWRGWR